MARRPVLPRFPQAYTEFKDLSLGPFARPTVHHSFLHSSVSFLPPPPSLAPFLLPFSPLSLLASGPSLC